MGLLVIFFAGLYLLLCLLFYFYQEKIFFYPRKLSSHYVFHFDDPFEEIFLPHEDGSIIHSLYFKVKNAKGLIIYFHGNAGNLQRWGKHARDFTAHGYSVLMPDYRGFGKSTGKISEENFHFDALQLFHWVQEQNQEKNIILYGRSLGTGIATKLAATKEVSKLILETPYYNFLEISERYFRILPKKLFRYTFRTDLWIQEVSCPVYFIHGTKDGVVPHVSGKKLARSVSKEDYFYSIPKGKHKNLSSFLAYHQHLEKILQD